LKERRRRPLTPTFPPSRHRHRLSPRLWYPHVATCCHSIYPRLSLMPRRKRPVLRRRSAAPARPPKPQATPSIVSDCVRLFRPVLSTYEQSETSPLNPQQHNFQSPSIRSAAAARELRAQGAQQSRKHQNIAESEERRWI